MSVVLIVLLVVGSALAVVGYVWVGVALGPMAYRVGYANLPNNTEGYRRDGALRLQKTTVFLWPFTAPHILSCLRRFADEKAGPNPDGLTRRQRRDLAYQRALTEILEQQHWHAEAALAAQKRSMDLQDRSPLNLAGRTR